MNNLNKEGLVSEFVHNLCIIYPSLVLELGINI